MGAVIHQNGRSVSKNPAKGITDLVVIIKNGPVIWAEIKRPGSPLTPHQKQFRNEILEMKHHHTIWHSLDEAIMELSPILGTAI